MFRDNIVTGTLDDTKPRAAIPALDRPPAQDSTVGVSADTTEEINSPAWKGPVVLQNKPLATHQDSPMSNR